MDYYKTVEKTLEYISDNIEQNITLEDLSSNVGYSQYHFIRIFSKEVGINPIEYVRSEKLSYAAKEIFMGERILDVAIKYGYETASGFSKAFKKEFGYTPTKYVSRMTLLETKGINIDNRRLRMDYKIVNKEAFKVIGYGIDTNINKESIKEEVAAFWNNYDTNGWEEKLYKKLNPEKHGEVGISISKDSGELKYVLGVIVKSEDNIEDNMMVIDVPSAKYAVFTTKPVDFTRSNGVNGEKEFVNAIKSTWKYIFEEWFKDSEYEYDDNKMDFEFYDERCHFRPDTVMEIYIPIKDKE